MNSRSAAPPPQDLKHFTKVAFALAASRMRQRYLRNAFGFAWFFITPLAIFSLYYFIFGMLLKVEWTDPRSGASIGYIGPFALGYAFYLFLADSVNGGSAGLTRTTNLIETFGVPLLTASFILEFLIRFALYLSVAIIVCSCAGQWMYLSGAAAFAFASLIFVVQTIAISVFLMFLTPFVGDVAEAARLSLRVFIYAAGISIPIDRYPQNISEILHILPLTGPLNGARKAFLFGETDPLLLQVAWTITALALAGGAWVFYKRLRNQIADIL